MMSPVRRFVHGSRVPGWDELDPILGGIDR